MPVNGVGSAGNPRVEQAPPERRVKETRVERDEQRQETDKAEQTRREPEEQRGDNVDLTA